MTIIKRGYHISSVRFTKIKGKCFYDRRTHRFVSRSRARKLTYQKLRRIKITRIVKAIQRKNPAWTRKEIIKKMAEQKAANKDYPRRWFSP